MSGLCWIATVLESGIDNIFKCRRVELTECFDDLLASRHGLASVTPEWANRVPGATQWAEGSLGSGPRSSAIASGYNPVFSPDRMIGKWPLYRQERIALGPRLAESVHDRTPFRQQFGVANIGQKSEKLINTTFTRR